MLRPKSILVSNTSSTRWTIFGLLAIIGYLGSVIIFNKYFISTSTNNSPCNNNNNVSKKCLIYENNELIKTKSSIENQPIPTTTTTLPPSPELFSQSSQSEQIILTTASIRFQNWLINHQNNCSLPIYSSTSHTYGLFSQILVLSNTLLEAVANGYVFTWEEAETKYSHCPKRNFDCWFKPITTCAITTTTTTSNVLIIRGRKSCVFDRKVKTGKSPPNLITYPDIIPTLWKLTGLDEFHTPHLFGPHFFLREALQYIMRPKPRLAQVQQFLLDKHLSLVQTVGKTPPRRAIRFALHVRSGDKKQFWYMNSLEHYVKHIKMRASLDFGAGIDQLLFTSDDITAYGKMQQYLDSSYNINDADRMARQEQSKIRLTFIPPEVFGKAAFEPNAVFRQTTTTTSESPNEQQLSLSELPPTVAELLIAQVFIFAQHADVFVGSFASNIGIAIHLLMGSIHQTSFPPAFDIAGSPFVPCSTMNAFPFHPLATENLHQPVHNNNNNKATTTTTEEPSNEIPNPD
jgi:hypothetical protein